MNSLFRAAQDSGSLFLFLDFDGTLVPLQTDPERVHLSPSRAKILTEPARGKKVFEIRPDVDWDRGLLLL